MTWRYTVIKYTTSEVRPSWASESWVTISRLSGFRQGAFITAHKPAECLLVILDWLGCPLPALYAPASMDAPLDTGCLGWPRLEASRVRLSFSRQLLWACSYGDLRGQREREQKFARSSEVEAGNWCFAIFIVSSWLTQVARPFKEKENRACLLTGQAARLHCEGHGFRENCHFCK